MMIRFQWHATAFVALGAGHALGQDCTRYLIDVNNLRLEATSVPPFDVQTYTGTVTVSDDANTTLENVRINDFPQAGADSTLADFAMTVTFENGTVTGGSLSMTDHNGHTYTTTLVGKSGVFETQGSFFFKFPAESDEGEISSPQFAGADFSHAFNSIENGSHTGNVLQFLINSGNNQDPSFVVTGVDEDTDCDIVLFGCGRTCAADYSEDGTTNGIDVGLFLHYYSSGSDLADLNHDGSIDGIDVALFLKSYAAGC